MREHLKSLDKSFKIRQSESPEQLRILIKTMQESYQSELGTLKNDIALKDSQLSVQSNLIANLRANLQVSELSLKQVKIVCLILATLCSVSVILMLMMHR